MSAESGNDFNGANSILNAPQEEMLQLSLHLNLLMNKEATRQ